MSLDEDQWENLLNDLKSKEPDELTDEMKAQLAEAQKAQKEKLKRYIQKNPSKEEKKKIKEQERKEKEKERREKEKEKKKTEKEKRTKKDETPGTPGKITNRKNSADTPKTSNSGK